MGEGVDDVGPPLRQLAVGQRAQCQLGPLGELLTEKVDVAQPKLDGQTATECVGGGTIVAATRREDGLEEDALVRDEGEIERGALSFDVGQVCRRVFGATKETLDEVPAGFGCQTERRRADRAGRFGCLARRPTSDS